MHANVSDFSGTRSAYHLIKRLQASRVSDGRNQGDKTPLYNLLNAALKKRLEDLQGSSFCKHLGFKSLEEITNGQCSPDNDERILLLLTLDHLCKDCEVASSNTTISRLLQNMWRTQIPFDKLKPLNYSRDHSKGGLHHGEASNALRDITNSVTHIEYFINLFLEHWYKDAAPLNEDERSRYLKTSDEHFAFAFRHETKSANSAFFESCQVIMLNLSIEKPDKLSILLVLEHLRANLEELASNLKEALPLGQDPKPSSDNVDRRSPSNRGNRSNRRTGGGINANSGGDHRPNKQHASDRDISQIKWSNVNSGAQRSPTCYQCGKHGNRKGDRKHQCSAEQTLAVWPQRLPPLQEGHLVRILQLLVLPVPPSLVTEINHAKEYLVGEIAARHTPSRASSPQ